MLGSKSLLRQKRFSVSLSQPPERIKNLLKSQQILKYLRASVFTLRAKLERLSVSLKQPLRLFRLKNPTQLEKSLLSQLHAKLT